MRVTFLGTGTSHGVPMIGCDCAVCRSDDPRNQRLRPSVYVETETAAVLVDPTPDFRTQALRAGVRRVDAVLLTHFHADHVLGLDDLRAFCRDGRVLPVHGLDHTLETVSRMFPYAFTEVTSDDPEFEFHVVTHRPQSDGATLRFGALTVQPVTLMHGRLPVSGFVFDDAFAYLTDCHEIPDAVIATVAGVACLTIDALRYRPHPTHLTVDQAVAITQRIQPGTAFLTHLCHEVDHGPAEAALPAPIRIAHDTMVLEIVDGQTRVVGER